MAALMGKFLYILHGKYCSGWLLVYLVNDSNWITLILLYYCNRYSRRLMWLRATKSNNNPAYIAKYFVDCVQNVGGKFPFHFCITVSL